MRLLMIAIGKDLWYLCQGVLGRQTYVFPWRTKIPKCDEVQLPPTEIEVELCWICSSPSLSPDWPLKFDFRWFLKKGCPIYDMVVVRVCKLCYLIRARGWKSLNTYSVPNIKSLFQNPNRTNLNCTFLEGLWNSILDFWTPTNWIIGNVYIWSNVQFNLFANHKPFSYWGKTNANVRKQQGNFIILY